MEINQDNIFDFKLNGSNKLIKKETKAPQDINKTNEINNSLNSPKIQIPESTNYIITNEKEGFYLINYLKNNNQNPKKIKLSEKPIKEFIQSPMGKYLAVYDFEKLHIKKRTSKKIYGNLENDNSYFNFEIKNLVEMSFSDEENLFLFSTKTKAYVFHLQLQEIIFEEEYKLEEVLEIISNPLYTKNENKVMVLFFIRNQTTIEKYVFNKKELTFDLYKSFKFPNNSKASVISLIDNFQILVSCHNKKLILVLDSNLNPIIPLKPPHKKYNVTEFYFNKKKNKMISIFTNFIDKTGNSYYGVSDLCLYNVLSGEKKNITTVKGPIHSISWSPNSEKFILIKGSLPAYVILYNKNAQPEILLGILFRNYVKWSKSGKRIAIAGFGNIDTKIDIFDYKTMFRISSIPAQHCSEIKWINDDLFITAVIFSKLKVDNNFRIFNVKGEKLFEVSYCHSALFQFKVSENNFYDDKIDLEFLKEIDDKKRKKVEVKKFSVFRKEKNEVCLIDVESIGKVNKNFEDIERDKEKLKKKNMNDKKKVMKKKIVFSKGSRFLEMKKAREKGLELKIEDDIRVKKKKKKKNFDVENKKNVNYQKNKQESNEEKKKKDKGEEKDVDLNLENLFENENIKINSNKN